MSRRRIVFFTDMLAVAVFLIFVWRYFTAPVTLGRKILRPGMHLTVQGLDWRQATLRNIVLIADEGCPVCTRAPNREFYTALSKSVQSSRNSLLYVITRGSPDDTTTWLSSLGVHAAKVIQVRIDELGVMVIPTIMVVDRVGLITNMWLGELNVDEKGAIYALIETDTTDAKSASPDAYIPREIDTQELQRLRALGSVAILDVREHAAAEKRPFPGAVNISPAQFDSRLNNELPQAATAVIPCTTLDYQQCVYIGMLVKQRGYPNVVVLTDQ